MSDKEKCPICLGEFADLPTHILKMHDSEEEEKPTPKIRNKTQSNLMKEAISRLEEQNQLLILQFQQNSLIKALQTGKLPQEDQPQPNQLQNLRETMQLLNEIRSSNPVGDFTQEAPSSEDMLLAGALDLIKLKMGGGSLPSPPPLPPHPQHPPLYEDLPEAPEIYETHDEVNKNVIEQEHNPMDSSLPSKAIGTPPTTTGEQQIIEGDSGRTESDRRGDSTTGDETERSGNEV